MTRLLLVSCLFFFGCQNSDNSDCPYPGHPDPANTLTFIGGDPEFCGQAVLDLPGSQNELTESWKPDACELTLRGTGTDAAGDFYSVAIECNVDAHGAVDCQITYVWPAYAESCSFAAQN